MSMNQPTLAQQTQQALDEFISTLPVGQQNEAHGT
jgi:hypothetical protein